MYFVDVIRKNFYGRFRFFVPLGGCLLSSFFFIDSVEGQGAFCFAICLPINHLEYRSSLICFFFSVQLRFYYIVFVVAAAFSFVFSLSLHFSISRHCHYCWYFDFVQNKLRWRKNGICLYLSTYPGNRISVSPHSDHHKRASNMEIK